MKARSSCAGDDGAGSPGLLFRGLGFRVEGNVSRTARSQAVA